MVFAEEEIHLPIAWKKRPINGRSSGDDPVRPTTAIEISPAAAANNRGWWGLEARHGGEGLPGDREEKKEFTGSPEKRLLGWSGWLKSSWEESIQINAGFWTRGRGPEPRVPNPRKLAIIHDEESGRNLDSPKRSTKKTRWSRMIGAQRKTKPTGDREEIFGQRSVRRGEVCTYFFDLTPGRRYGPAPERGGKRPGPGDTPKGTNNYCLDTGA
ncbi:hypothetical protein H0E87_031721 [Populus deltoides]|uniref:Uncharacterized protein n=1 Tax=Populus deltoides TaxID=3696 RepID=A0A8T2WII2_POPDE|nr:hypothetical protein H0E87_031721 [Populus deltoides]